MEIINAYPGNGHPSSAGGFHKRYTNLIDLDYSYKLFGEVFRVDDLLDFTNEDLAAPIGSLTSDVKPNNTPQEPVSAVTKATKEETEDEEDKADADADAAATETKEELELMGMHCDGLPELDWLSNFVEDSSSMGDHEAQAATKFAGGAYPFKNSSRDKEFARRREYEEVDEGSPSGLESSSNNNSGVWKDKYLDLTSVPGRARSKRTRAGTTKVWSSEIFSAPSSSTTSGSSEPVSMLEEDTSTTPALQCCSSSFSADSGFNLQQDDDFEFVMPPVKKANSGSRGTCGGGGSNKSKKQDSSQLQKCLHCGSQKTPQWRTGPLGPKTLCNACGVRFKSGRLYPEYRPAASPSFVPQKHSNSHKKVLEMRRLKETTTTSTTTTTTAVAERLAGSCTTTATTTTSTTDDDEEAGY